MNDVLAAAMQQFSLLFDGSMGWAILVLAFTVGLALLPLTLWKLSAAMGLYWLASAAVGAVQTFVLRHERRCTAAVTTA